MPFDDQHWATCTCVQSYPSYMIPRMVIRAEIQQVIWAGHLVFVPMHTTDEEMRLLDVCTVL